MERTRKHDIAISSVEASIEIVIYLKEADFLDATTANVMRNTYIQ